MNSNIDKLYKCKTGIRRGNLIPVFNLGNQHLVTYNVLEARQRVHMASNHGDYCTRLFF